jgi:hypothetical protein
VEAGSAVGFPMVSDYPRARYIVGISSTGIVIGGGSPFSFRHYQKCLFRELW